MVVQSKRWWMRGILATLFTAFMLASFTARVSAQEVEPSPSSVEDVKDQPTFLARFNKKAETILFFDVAFGKITVDEVDRAGNPVLDESGVQKKKDVPVPFLVVVLIAGAIFFTFRFRWINVRGFKHSIDVIRGKYDDPADRGEISHFRALTSALSATVGLGNIAGVAIAIQLGGPGAVFWMLIAALFGMTAKFTSCTLSQMYRQVNPDGSVSGGPMYYLDFGLKSLGRAWAPLGKVLAVMYAFMIMGGAIGGGNMFQSNQSFAAIASTFGTEAWTKPGSAASWIFGVVLAVMVGLVVIGGIRRIGAVTARIVPVMCGLYVVVSLFIIVLNIDKVPETIRLIVTMAFMNNALFGGAIGVLMMGVKRAAFSNEAGLGSAAIAHAAAKTEEPVREGIVAMIGPFIDTIIVCLMTALVVIITGLWRNPDVGAGTAAGVALTVEAYRSAISWFPYLLGISIVLFAYSTMISWCYYAERGWCYLLDHFGGIGQQTVIVFRVIFVVAVVAGAVAPLKDVLGFSDMMILCMAFPNIVGSVILAPKVLKKLNDYWGRFTSGRMHSH